MTGIADTTRSTIANRTKLRLIDPPYLMMAVAIGKRIVAKGFSDRKPTATGARRAKTEE
jgi:hypothetical protein